MIPGWAADYRIFDKLNLDFNYILPLDLSISDFENNLILFLKKYSIRKISLLGWSLGGFLAADFCQKKYSLVDQLFLVGIRQKYDFQEIDKIKEILKDKRKGYLYKFYSDCFYRDKNFKYFKKMFIKNYLKQIELDSLLSGLNYLQRARIGRDKLKKLKKIKIIHGEFDKIVPLEQAKKIKSKIPQADFRVIKDSGHIPFFNDNFKQYLK